MPAFFTHTEKYPSIILTFLVWSICFATAHAQAVLITNTQPANYAPSVDPGSNITITFNKTVQSPAHEDFYVYSKSRGLVQGTVSVNVNTLTFAPQNDFFPGDQIWVHVTGNVTSSLGEPLENPRQYYFTVRSTSAVDPPLFKEFSISNNPGATIETLSTADFDLDGDMDIIAEGLWMENDGQENFIPHQFEGVIGSTWQAIVVDIDYDGDMDLIAGTYYGVLFLENDGAMGFTPQRISPDLITHNVSIADKNNDGLLDVLFADRQSNSTKNLTWLINNGDGTFTTEVVATDKGIGEILTVDLNNDGLMDVVTAGYNHIYWFRNEGSSFTEVTIQSDGSYYQELSAADLDGDNDLDLLVSDGSQIYRIENNSSDAFTVHSLNIDPYNGGDIFGVADIDGDGDPDLMASIGGYLKYFENMGNNAFTQREVIYLGDRVHAAIAQDMDYDGDLDLVYFYGYQRLRWLKNTTLAEAIPFESVPLTDAFPETTNSAAWADYDLDGDQDVLITATQYPSPITRLYRRTPTSFEVAANFTGVFNGTSQWFDFENDGDPDILLSGLLSTDNGESQTFIYINTNGSFTLLPASSSLPGTSSGQVKAADLNNDGQSDIVIAGQDAGIYAMQDGSFKEVFPIGFIFQGARIAVSDIDLDGDLDFAVTGWQGNDELGPLRSVFINEGNFRFTEKAPSFNGITEGNLLLHDLDGDGDPELAAIGPHRSNGNNYSSSSFYKNNAGEFEKLERPETGIYISVDFGGAASAGDFDNDGYADVVTQNGSYYRGLNLFFNDRVGWFNRLDYLFPDVSSEARFITPIDFDLDQDLDMLSGKTLIRNNTATKNQSPSAPTQLYDSVRNNTIYAYWSGATDVETPSAGLSYQLYVGSTPGGHDIESADANHQTGQQYIQHHGPARKFWKVSVTTGGNFYWGVQAIDAGMLASPFSSEKTVQLIYLDGPDSSCTNTTQKYKALPAGNYTWKVVGGQIISSTADEIEIVWDVEGYGTVGVTNGTAKNTLDVRLVTRPQPLILGSDIVCEESAENAYETATVDQHTYHWTIEGGSFLDAPNSPGVFVEWGPNGGGKINLFETSRENICTVENSFSVNIAAKPKPIIEGDAEPCENLSMEKYKIVPTSPGNSIEWMVFGGDIEGNSTTDEIVVQWHNQALGRVTVKETHDFCSEINILEVQLPRSHTPDIQGDFYVCDDTKLFSYYTRENEDYGYQWTVTGGILDGPSTNAEISVQWNDTGIGKITLSQIHGDCVARDSVYVNVYPPFHPVINIGDDGAFVVAPAVSYQWHYEGEEIEGATSQEFHPSDAGLYFVTVTDEKGCTGNSEELPYPITGVESQEGFLTRFYPNPVTDDYIIIEMDNNYRGLLEITQYDMVGKPLSKVTMEKDQQHFKKQFFPEQSSGIVVIDIRASSFSIRKKIMTK